MSKRPQKAARQQWEEEERTRNAARQLGGTVDIPLDDEDHGDTIRIAKKRPETPTALAMYCVKRRKGGKATLRVRTTGMLH